MNSTNSTWAADDEMDLDSTDECEGILPKLKHSIHAIEANDNQDLEPPFIYIYKTGPDLVHELLLARNWIDAHPWINFTDARKNNDIWRLITSCKIHVPRLKRPSSGMQLLIEKRGVTNIGFRTIVSKTNSKVRFTHHSPACLQCSRHPWCCIEF